MAKGHTILVLSTYPLRKSIHGGQRRSRALVEAYERAGCRVIQAAIFNPPSYSHPDERAEFDLPAPALTLNLIKKNPILEDIILGQSCYDDPEVKAHIVALIQKFKPDYIDFEQPYLYIGMQKLLNDLTIPPKLIFSSQNVEYKMKARIYENHQHTIDLKTAKKYEALIRKTEEELCRNAEIVMAVSQSDLEEHKKMGAKRTLLIPNGINAGVLSQKHVQKWKKFFESNGIKKPILFTGSAHPPNWTGFLEMLGGRVGFLPITSKLMIVGDIGDALQYVLYQKDPIYSSSFWLRAHNCKRLSDADLTALIHLCDTIILPITEGGGSNLKTAEAIYSAKKVIATVYAMRGYEEFTNYPNIFIENDPLMFKEQLLTALNNEIPELNKEQIEGNKSVLWDARTKPLVSLITKGGL